MEPEFFIYEKRERVAHITINRPEVLNALHPPAYAELYRMWDDIEADDDVWLSVLTGSGDRAFCAGHDLKYASKREATPSWALLDPEFRGYGSRRSRLPNYKPMIAAVNGFALGTGMWLAMNCDLVLAADHAEFGLPEPRNGFFGGAELVLSQLPEKFAMEILLTGKRLPASEAHRMGLVNRVVPAAELAATVDEWTADILKCAPLALRANKQAAKLGRHLPLELAGNVLYEQGLRATSSEDFKEGLRAFSERRAPRWEGR